MSDPDDGVRASLVNVDDIRESGNPWVSDEVNEPVVEVTPYVLDDEDNGECRYATADEVRSMYIDNPVTVEPVQADVWTLEMADGEELTFTYDNGRTYTVRFADIDTNSGQDAARYYKVNDLIYPTDEGQNVVLNATSTPRLAGVKRYILEELARRSEQRLEMAELVNAFSTIISQNSGALSK